MRKSEITLCVALLAAFSGCNPETTLQNELGLKVTYASAAVQSDACVMAQLEAFVTQYQALSEADRAALKQALAGKYANLAVPAPKVSSQVEGTVSTLHFLRKSCSSSSSSSCVEQSIGQKNVSDLRTAAGTPPSETRIERAGDTLTLVSEVSMDRSKQRLYVTFDLDTYDRTDSDDALVSGLRDGRIEFRQEVGEPREGCGQVLSIQKLADRL